MTREENLHWIDEEIRTWENECQSKHPIIKALYAAREALEQDKPMVEIDLYSVIKQKYIERGVLDKIRARIELEKLGYPPSAEYYKAIKKCLQIIDKYKTESEEI